MPTSVTTPDDLTPLLDRLTALESTTEQQALSLAAHEQRITARENADSAQASAIAGNTAAIAALDARVTALETPVPVPPPTGEVVLGLWYAAQSDYPTLKAKGFTAVHEWADTTGGRKAQIDAARAAGLDFCLDLSWAMEGGTFRQSRLDNMLTHYVNYPGIRWVVSYDEPDLGHYSTAECDKMYRAVKAAWPSVLQKVTIRYPFRTSGAPYLPYCDIVSVDPYIIPYGPPEQAGQETASTVAVAGGKPVATDVQTFNWKTTFSPPGRYPTVAEVQTMATTSAKAQGTRRMLWYWDRAGLTSSEGAAVYAAMPTINAAVRAA